jgi:hypothetical protein
MLFLQLQKVPFWKEFEERKADHAVAIFGHKRHLPDILETHILNSMPEDVGIYRVVVLIVQTFATMLHLFILFLKLET